MSFFICSEYLRRPLSVGRSLLPSGCGAIPKGRGDNFVMIPAPVGGQFCHELLLGTGTILPFWGDNFAVNNFARLRARGRIAARVSGVVAVPTATSPRRTRSTGADRAAPPGAGSVGSGASRLPAWRATVDREASARLRPKWASAPGATGANFINVPANGRYDLPT